MEEGKWHGWRLPVVFVALLMAVALAVPAGAGDDCDYKGTSGPDFWWGDYYTGDDFVAEVYCGGFGYDVVYFLGEGDVFHGGPDFGYVRYNYGTFHGGQVGDRVVNNWGIVHGGGGGETVEINHGTFHGGQGGDYVSYNYGTFHGGNGGDAVAYNLSGGEFYGGNGFDIIFGLNEGFFDPGRQ